MAIGEAERSPGWALLDEGQKRALSALLGGRDNPWSTGARVAIREVVEDARWSTATPDAQKEMLLGVWRHTRVRPRSVATLALTPRNERAPYTLRGPMPLGTVELDGTPEDSVRHELEVDGRRIQIDAPVSGPREGTLLSAEEAARALADLPRSARDEVDSVVLVPFRNPRDEDYARDFAMPGFRTFMEGRSSGTVLVFPRLRATVDPTDMLLHEVAHVWSLRDLDDAQWRAWERAEEEDGHDVSAYAATHPREDLAETAAVWVAFRGRAGWGEVRAMFAARFALLEAWAPRAR